MTTGYEAALRSAVEMYIEDQITDSDTATPNVLGPAAHVRRCAKLLLL